MLQRRVGGEEGEREEGQGECAEGEGGEDAEDGGC